MSENYDLITTVLAIVILFIGILMGSFSLYRWRKSGNYLQLLSSLIFFGIPTPWLANILVYFTRDTTRPSDFVLIFISAILVPLFITAWIHITTSLYPDTSIMRRVAVSLSIIIGLVFYYAVFVGREYTITPIPDSDILAIGYNLVPMIMVGLYGVLGLVFIFPSYLYFSIKSKNALFKFRFRMIALGILFFDLSAVSDAMSARLDIWIMIIARILIIFSLIFLLLGYLTPEFIRQKYED